MEAVVKHSVLNPFASCFIPSNFRKFENKIASTKLKYEEEKKSNAVTSNIIEVPRDQGKELDTVPYSFSENKDFVIPPEVEIVNESIDCENGAFDLETEDGMSWSKTASIAFLELLILILSAFYSRKNFTTTCNTDDSHEKKSSDFLKKSKCDDCTCPAIFGYVIPPNFFGNPFNLNYSCKKNGIHTSYASPDLKMREVPEFVEDSSLHKTLDLKGKTTLEQYSLELSMIIKDVCETIGTSIDDCMDHDVCTEQIQNKSEQEDTPSSTTPKDIETETIENKISPIGTKTSSRNSSCSKDDLLEVTDDLHIEDDEDAHPLLNAQTNQDDNEEVFADAYIQKMIEAGLASKAELLSDSEELSENSSCNPPCSFWCDSVPQSARDSYKKFVKSLSQSDESSRKFATESSKQLFNKPLYRRSFSANDCIKKSENLPHTQLCFDDESRERLLLLRRDPVSYFKLDSSGHPLNRSNSLSSALKEDFWNSQVNEIQYNSRLKDRSSMWGPFDGADSLWQPLPDCVPINENHSKSNRKAREMRRQRSVN